MKIKLDENLPVRLARALEKLGHDTDTIPEEGLTGRNDIQVWGAAQETDRFFITQDLDFSDTRRFTPGTHHGILLERNIIAPINVTLPFLPKKTKGGSRP